MSMDSSPPATTTLKLQPVISFYKPMLAWKHWTVNVSKAISQEDAMLICDNVNDEEWDLTMQWAFEVNADMLDMVVNNAFMYGFDFPTEFDRRMYEEKSRTFKLVLRSS
jgi:hypothetical protein